MRKIIREDDAILSGYSAKVRLIKTEKHWKVIVEARFFNDEAGLAEKLFKEIQFGDPDEPE